MNSFDHLSHYRLELLDATWSMAERMHGLDLDPEEIEQLAEETVDLLP